jgi:hypothetical protein
MWGGTTSEIMTMAIVVFAADSFRYYFTDSKYFDGGDAVCIWGLSSYGNISKRTQFLSS